ncbi:MAG: DNA polymerase [Candidatus Pacebacteria bacterium]|nr:DNA polymerase [Candidatus Paceibacterota bacterium]
MAFIYLDIETDNSQGFGLDPFRSKVVTLQLLLPDGRPCVIKDPENLDALKPILERNIIVGTNLKFDTKFLKHHFGVNITKIFDIMIAEQVLSGGELTGFTKGRSLKDLVFKYCGAMLDKTAQTSFKFGVPLTKTQEEYAVSDIKYLPQILKQQQAKIKAAGLEAVIAREMSAIPAVVWLELSGMPVDLSRLKEIEARDTQRKEALEAELKKELSRAGSQQTLSQTPSIKPINLNSTKQLTGALRAKGYEIEGTSKEALSMYAADPLIQKLWEYKKLQKKLSSFIKTMPNFINPETGRIHPSFDQYGTRSGRFSCRAPNLQQQPSRGEEGAEWRTIFRAQPGYKIVAADFSQIELRILGELAEEQEFIRAYTQGIDLHKLTASKIFKVPLEEVTKTQRSIAKTVNFGLNYGMWRNGLQLRLREDAHIEVSLDEAEQFIRDFQQAYPAATDYLNRISKEGLQKLALRNRAGRLLKLTTPRNEREEGTVKREAKNLPIQSLCADIIKDALKNIYARLEPRGVLFINTVHDELVFECKEEQAEEVSRVVKEEMERAGQLYLKKIPVLSEVVHGDSWSL